MKNFIGAPWDEPAHECSPLGGDGPPCDRCKRYWKRAKHRESIKVGAIVRRQSDGAHATVVSLPNPYDTFVVCFGVAGGRKTVSADIHDFDLTDVEKP